MIGSRTLAGRFSRVARTPLGAGIGWLGIAALSAIAGLRLADLTSGRELAFAVVTVFAAIGIFALISAAFPEVSRRTVVPEFDYLAGYNASLREGLLLTGADNSIAFSNAAFWRFLDRPAAPPGPFDLATALGQLEGGSEAAYRLARAAANCEDWEEVFEQPSAAPKASAGRWLRVALECLSAGPGRTYLAWRINDVTLEHTRQSESLQRLRRNLEQLDGVPAGLFVLGSQDRLSYLNATLADWVGVDRKAAESGGIPFEPLLGPEGMALIGAELSASPASGAIAVDVELHRVDGARMPARLMGRTQPASNQLAAGVFVSRSAGERPEDGASAAEARFTRLFHAAPIAIATIEAGGRIGNANPAFTRMFFGNTNSLAANGVELLERLHVEGREAVRGALQLAARGEKPAQPIEFVLNENTRRSGQLFLNPNTAVGAERDSVTLYALDTTERKELELQFAQSQKMQAIGQLAGGIAHDINNVLTVIIGFSDLLLANSAGDPAFHDLSEIKANANRAANLVRQLLAFSRRQTLRPEVLSLNEVISDLTVFLKRSLGEKVKLERDYGRDLWLVKADQTELGRVFVNLAVNAVDAMPTGGKLTIRTTNIPRDEAVRLALTGLEPGDYVLCSVTDTGHGMTPEILQKIFEPFFTTKDVGKGTGLGLSTVYGIVKQTGGYIYCESAPGLGTTFRLYLPRHVAGSGNSDTQTKTERKERPRDLTGSGTVLLVEDEESVRRFAARALRRQGYLVLEAGNGLEALQAKAGHDGVVDLVVSDIVMPEMDGPTLLKELRKTNPDLKIIFMSGYADDALSSLDSGEEFAFLSKPFQLADLVTAVKELIFR